MSAIQPIVIVGAGVLGLTTAELLYKQYPHARITIVAAEIPLVAQFADAPRPSPDYASMWAGAHFRPTPGKGPGQLAEEQVLALKTSTIMRNLAIRHPESGVQRIIGREIMEYVPDDKVHFQDGDVYSCADGGEFRVLKKDELESGGLWGCEYQTWIVNVHVYCRWLLTRFIRSGGNLMQRRLSTLEEAFDVLPRGSRTPIVVNCSGRNFDTDPLVDVIRGQTVLVSNTYHKTATRHNMDGSWSFLIPRPLGGGTIVGGTKQKGDWGTEIREQETKEILENAVKSWPGFASKVEDLEIMAINVGRRPWREGGLRIEVELINPGKVVVHGYGAGARGYELSWGAAESIATKVIEQLKPMSKI